MQQSILLSHVPYYFAGEKQVLLQGTLGYLAPEVIDQWIAKDRSTDPSLCDPAAADMWSLGVVLLEVYTGKKSVQGKLILLYKPSRAVVC